MGKYIATQGQNLYDIALHIYGSIEGITDLLANNESLSLSTRLKTGDELIYSDNYVINSDVVAYLQTHSITPATSERNVYPRYPSLPKAMDMYTSSSTISVGFSATGSGDIEVDWGDNSDLLEAELSDTTKEFTHTFDNKSVSNRKITFYTSAYFKSLDLSSMKSSELYIAKPIEVERLTIQNQALSLESLPILSGTFKLTLQNIDTNNLLPLADLTDLMELEITGHNYPSSTIDKYLCSIVENYGNRRNCKIILDTEPSEIGYAAIHTIINEPKWNEGGAWEFIINNESYKYE